MHRTTRPRVLFKGEQMVMYGKRLARGYRTLWGRICRRKKDVMTPPPIAKLAPAALPLSASHCPKLMNFALASSMDPHIDFGIQNPSQLVAARALWYVSCSAVVAQTIVEHRQPRLVQPKLEDSHLAVLVKVLCCAFKHQHIIGVGEYGRALAKLISGSDLRKGCQSMLPVRDKLRSSKNARGACVAGAANYTCPGPLALSCMSLLWVWRKLHNSLVASCYFLS